MRKLQRILPGTKIKAEHINMLIEAVEMLGSVSVGPGLSMKQNASGISISLRPRAVESGSKAAKGSIENPKTMNWDPTAGAASDTWDVEDDAVAVQVKVITGIRWDEDDTKRLQVKYRTFLYDSLGQLHSITAETAWTDIVQFVEHPL